MDTAKLPRKYKVYLPLTILFLLLMFFMPKTPEFNYEYKKGSPWMYETLITQFDFPILKTESQLQEERERISYTVIPYYKLDADVDDAAMSKVAALDLGKCEPMHDKITELFKFIYGKGVLSSVLGNLEAISSTNEVYLQRDRRAERIPVSELFTKREAEQYLKRSLAQSDLRCNIDSLCSAVGLLDIITPNFIYDQKITEIIIEESLDDIPTTMGVVSIGQVIVSKGEIITDEVEQLLDSYKAEYEAKVGYDGPYFLQWVGCALISLILVFVLMMALCYCNPNVFDKYNKYLYIVMIFAFVAVIILLIQKRNPELYYLFPFSLAALYLLAFFTKRMVFVVYVISLLPMLIFAHNGVELFVIYLVAGVTAILVFGYFNKGWLQFITALIVYCSMALVWFTFRLVEGWSSMVDYYQLIFMLFGAFLLVAGYPFIYLFEKIFKLVSSSKLVELSDTSNKILRELADRAPGTFQHALQVMNLSDAAARSIGADVHLVRAGALYHDIGKINNPQCFTENETPGVMYHSGLTPKESAQEIVRHVADGLAIADKYSLPQELKNFISTHHGTTSTGYFYTKYLNDGGDPNDVAEFFYDGEKPTTREQVILMLCDSIEAASRSLPDHSPDKISELVERIVDGKISDGQLSNAEISLHELNVLKDVIKTYLKQMYHSRVVYPRRKAKIEK